MPVYTDQLNNKINLSSAPRRIVSLVPSQSELLASLGLENEVIGITKFCVHPESWFRNKIRVGGTKTVNIKTVASLKPDLILANKEENTKEQVDALQSIAPVWTSDVNSVTNALDMIQKIGDLTNRSPEAIAMVQTLRKDFLELAVQISQNSPKPRTAYLIWKDPYMAAGGGTFIHDMLGHCGWENIFGSKTRYPQTSVEELISLQPELVLLSSEPYPFGQKHIGYLQENLKKANIILVDGEMFSWYGSRMLEAPAYMRQLLERNR